jgi:hypothetical protein
MRPSVGEARIHLGLNRYEGTAAYRERMALPPSAAFEATLEDVSRADARWEPRGGIHRSDSSRGVSELTSIRWDGMATRDISR